MNKLFNYIWWLIIELFKEWFIRRDLSFKMDIRYETTGMRMRK